MESGSGRYWNERENDAVNRHTRGVRTEPRPQHSTAQHSRSTKSNDIQGSPDKGGWAGAASRQGGLGEATGLVIYQRQMRWTSVGRFYFRDASAVHQPNSPGHRAYYIRQTHLPAQDAKTLGQICLSHALFSSPSRSRQKHFSSISSETFVARAYSIKSAPRRAVAARA